jgi:thiamine biosynthesis lipoprotein
LFEQTGGAFDITSAPLSKLWGFHDRRGRFPEAHEIDQVLERVGSRWLRLDAEAHTVGFEKPGLEINLGSIGKGFALDRCAHLMLQRGVADFLVHGGQSSVLAQGSRMGIEPAGWWVALKHPFRESQRLGEIRLQDQALGTSGSGNQFFHFRGRRYGHILDPRSGWPVEGMLATTVLAPNAALADGLATALHVLGREAAEDFCRRHAELGAILVCPASRSGGIELVTVGVPENQWRPAADVPSSRR